MKNFTLIFLAGITLYTHSGCKTPDKKQETELDNTIKLIIEPGEQWLGKMKVFLFFNIQKTPQMAAWIEDDKGQFISSIVVTGKSVKQNWTGAPKNGRPEALPVWNHKQRDSSELEPQPSGARREDSPLDAISTATPKGSIEAKINEAILAPGETYNVYFEINHSFDYNDFWTKDNSGVNGQPSLIYHAKFIAGTSGEIKLNPIGNGSVDGSHGNITHELENFTSALHIVKDVYIKCDSIPRKTP